MHSVGRMSRRTAYLVISLIFLQVSVIKSFISFKTRESIKFLVPIIDNHRQTQRHMQLHGQIGTVALVGAGPGNPDLLTIQAMNFIKKANLVIADRLISKEILELVTCELRIANKKPGCADEAQEEIYEWVKQAVLEGKNVVRLKIGDPFLFGRGGEEVLEYRQKLGVEPIISPGLSSSYAAPLVANIPLTHRETANNVVITTGYGRNSTFVDVPDYDEERTVVLLMAIGRLKEIVASMIAKNYPTSTSVAIIENATTPRERVLVGDLLTICEVATRNEARPPAVIVVGEVVNVLR